MALAIQPDKKQSDGLHYSTVIPIAILLLAIGIVGFFLIHTSVTTHKGLAIYDTPVLAWMTAHRNTELTTTMQIVTNILSPTGILIGAGAIALVWGVIKRELWRPFLLVLAMGATYLVSTGVKEYIHRSRPPLESMIKPLETDFSFPSGHTIGLAAALLVISYLICSRAHNIFMTILWIIISVTGIALIAFSRLYLGYHWLTDVSASVALALILLAFIIFFDSIVSKLRKQ